MRAKPVGPSPGRVSNLAVLTPQHGTRGVPQRPQIWTLTLGRGADRGWGLCQDTGGVEAGKMQTALY